MHTEKCESCKYHDSFSWVCFNGDSPNVADFTDNEDYCNEYVGREDRGDVSASTRRK